MIASLARRLPFFYGWLIVAIAFGILFLGGLDWRLLTHGDGHRLLLRTLNLAEELHEKLTRRHGLTSLRGPVEEIPPRDAKARRRAK